MSNSAIKELRKALNDRDGLKLKELYIDEAVTIKDIREQVEKLGIKKLRIECYNVPAHEECSFAFE